MRTEQHFLGTADPVDEVGRQCHVASGADLALKRHDPVAVGRADDTFELEQQFLFQAGGDLGLFRLERGKPPFAVGQLDLDARLLFVDHALLLLDQLRFAGELLGHLLEPLFLFLQRSPVVHLPVGRVPDLLVQRLVLPLRPDLVHLTLVFFADLFRFHRVAAQAVDSRLGRFLLLVALQVGALEPVQQLGLGGQRPGQLLDLRLDRVLLVQHVLQGPQLVQSLLNRGCPVVRRLGAYEFATHASSVIRSSRYSSR